MTTGTFIGTGVGVLLLLFWAGVGYAVAEWRGDGFISKMNWIMGIELGGVIGSTAIIVVVALLLRK